jgi:hypothetical protein
MIGPTVVVRRAGTKTDRYNPTTVVPDWDNVTSETSVDLLAPPAPRRTSEAGIREDTDRRQGTIYGYTLYFPEATDVLSADRVVLWGDEYDVDGEPGRWTSGTGSALGGLEVDVVRAS